VLGALYAAIAALTFALNNATLRRGVVTGTVMQAMAVTVPVGAAGFLVLALAAGALPALIGFPAAAAAWMAGQGIVHFLIGRFFNYRANQLVGVNLSAPVVQLQVVVAMALAVLTMHEPFTVLQSIGALLMLAGSFATQKRSAKRTAKPAKEASTRRPAARPAIASGIDPKGAPAFTPRHVAGYLFSSCAAIAYGISPLMVRLAFDSAPQASVLAGAVIAYASATAVFSLLLLRSEVRRDISGLKRENIPWFLCAAVLVTVSQGFVYASLAVAPLMVVTPILQLSLVFRVFLSWLINREYEVLNASVLIGAAAAIIGSILVSLSTDFVASAAALPDALSSALRFRLAGVWPRSAGEGYHLPAA
jgi:drug/metabolite transporter (DMT)-like permease